MPPAPLPVCGIIGDGPGSGSRTRAGNQLRLHQHRGTIPARIPPDRSVGRTPRGLQSPVARGGRTSEARVYYTRDARFRAERHPLSHNSGLSRSTFRTLRPLRSPPTGPTVAEVTRGGRLLASMETDVILRKQGSWQLSAISSPLAPPTS